MLSSLGGGMADLSPNCRRAAHLQSEALDHTLTLRQRVGLKIHLLLCKWCRRYGRQIRFLRKAAQDHAPELTEASPQQLSTEARERIKRELSSRK